MNDPEYVASLEELRKREEATGRKPPSGVRISESTPEVRELREMAAKITRLTNVVLGAVGGKPIHEAAKKYLTAHAIDADPDARLAKHRAIVDRVLPKKAAPVAESPTAEGTADEK